MPMIDLVLRTAISLELAVLAGLLTLLPRAGLAARLGALFCASVLAFVLAAVHEAWRGLATDLVEKRRRFRVGLVAGVAAYLAIVVTVQLSNLALGTHTAPPLVLANLGLMLAAGFAATLSLLQVRRGTWIDVVCGSDVEAAVATASA